MKLRLREDHVDLAQHHRGGSAPWIQDASPDSASIIESDEACGLTDLRCKVVRHDLNQPRRFHLRHSSGEPTPLARGRPLTHPNVAVRLERRGQHAPFLLIPCVASRPTPNLADVIEPQTATRAAAAQSKSFFYSGYSRRPAQLPDRERRAIRSATCGGGTRGIRGQSCRAGGFIPSHPPRSSRSGRGRS